MSFCCFADEVSPADLFDEKWCRARKTYRCCECYATIDVGDKYQHIKMLENHHWYTYRTCVPCADLRESLEEVTCVYYEGLADAYQEFLTEAPGKVMRVREGSHAARLVPGYFIADREGEDE